MSNSHEIQVPVQLLIVHALAEKEQRAPSSSRSCHVAKLKPPSSQASLVVAAS